MIPNPSATSRHSVFAGPILIAAFFLASAGCEDKAIGRVCDVQVDAGTLQAVYNAQALECPSRLCLKPARDNSIAGQIDTAAYCSAECSNDSDCEGEKRNTSNEKDFRCKTGFVCGVAFEVGPLCCKKLCLCKDFITVPSGGLKTPASCNTAGVSTCQNL